MEENGRSSKKQKTSEVTESSEDNSNQDEYEEGEFYVVVELPEYENSNVFQTAKNYSTIVIAIHFHF